MGTITVDPLKISQGYIGWGVYMMKCGLTLLMVELTVTKKQTSQMLYWESKFSGHQQTTSCHIQDNVQDFCKFKALS